MGRTWEGLGIRGDVRPISWDRAHQRRFRGPISDRISCTSVCPLGHFNRFAYPFHFGPFFAVVVMFIFGGRTSREFRISGKALRIKTWTTVWWWVMIALVHHLTVWCAAALSRRCPARAPGPFAGSPGLAETQPVCRTRCVIGL